jgi:hypothetical protein
MLPYCGGCVRILLRGRTSTSAAFGDGCTPFDAKDGTEHGPLGNGHRRCGWNVRLNPYAILCPLMRLGATVGNRGASASSNLIPPLRRWSMAGPMVSRARRLGLGCVNCVMGRRTGHLMLRWAAAPSADRPAARRGWTLSAGSGRSATGGASSESSTAVRIPPCGHTLSRNAVTAASTRFGCSLCKV